MLPLVVHQNGREELGCSRWSFTRTAHAAHRAAVTAHAAHWDATMSVTQVEFPGLTDINGVEELGCSRWSFTRMGGRS